MIISIMVAGSPVSAQSARTALSFCTAAVAAGHQLYRIFFYEDGVMAGSALNVSPQDEADLNADWAAFIKAHQLDAVVCVASALKRGVLDAGEAARYEKPAANLRENFTVSGLGQWVDACIHSDRVVSFGT